MNIYESICSIMSEVKAIGKDKKNQQQGFSYRGIDDVYNRLQPLLAQNKVFTVPEVLEERTEDRKSSKGNALIYRVLKIKYTFFAEDGTSVSSVVIGEGMDSGDKASNKAMAIAHKYALFQVFCIPTEDIVDPDSEVHKVQPKAQEIDEDARILRDNIGKSIAKLAPKLSDKQVDQARDLYKKAGHDKKKLNDLIEWVENLAQTQESKAQQLAEKMGGEVVTPEDVY